MTDKNIIKDAEYCSKDQRAELEELGKKLMRSQLKKEMLHKTIEEIKLEVIKEFMDRLKEKKKMSHLNEGIVTMDIIESIIEEMIGEIQ